MSSTDPPVTTLSHMCWWDPTTEQLLWWTYCRINHVGGKMFDAMPYITCFECLCRCWCSPLSDMSIGVVHD